ncbi:hypothetical protein LTR78_006602 [Recurvomyces mirabilis]|uniref:MmgE/PrpD family protein n=1 Tax=Recurvomyces mirabilis TaxID=574656 RepID=A0AAE0WKG4_9PEZI|nr:hypothetical protein LTR78_006602 [Recurvomyces mirabilis]KAK5149430.1 hypothetical protein LTS14_010950 [Recurvomyces mirabilis]
MTTTNGLTNGKVSTMTNDHTRNSDMNGNNSEAVPVTHLLATFAASAKTTDLTSEIREKCKEVLLDFIGVTVGAITHADSTPPIITAISALQGPTVTTATPGTCIVLGLGPPAYLPHYAGLLNAALGHSLDFDDTYAPGTLHAGVTAISAALACYESLASIGEQRSADDVFLAISIGYEITCRLGRELGYAAYSRGFHNTSTGGIFGAIATIARLRRLPASTIASAFGLAGSKASGSMQYLANGSWNKRLHPGFAVHDAFMCVALAEAGVIGASGAIEGETGGFLQAYTPSQDVSLERLVGRLGEEWCWLASSLKPYPACRMTHGFIEMSGRIHDSAVKPNGTLALDQISNIHMTMSPANYILIGNPTPNKVHPTNTIDAQFSAYFQVANTLVHGAKTGDMSPYTRLASPVIHALSEKITVTTDGTMKGFAARMRIVWADGRKEEIEQQFPLGEVEHPFTKDKVREKFMSLAEPVYGPEKSVRITEMVEKLDSGDQDVMSLIRLLR